MNTATSCSTGTTAASGGASTSSDRHRTTAINTRPSGRQQQETDFYAQFRGMDENKVDAENAYNSFGGRWTPIMTRAALLELSPDFAREANIIGVQMDQAQILLHDLQQQQIYLQIKDVL